MGVDASLSSAASELLVQGLEGLDDEGAEAAIGRYRVASYLLVERYQDGPDGETRLDRSYAVQRQYSYHLKEPGGKRWLCVCKATHRAKERAAPLKSDTDLSDSFGSPRLVSVSLDSELLACRFRRSVKERGWTMDMTRGEFVMLEGGLEKGTFSAGKHSMEVVHSVEMKGTDWPHVEPTGYYFVQGDRYVAAVQIGKLGKVWLHRDLTKSWRHAVAAAATALLLHDSMD